MSSGRKFCVQRHVRNIHLGEGGIIPFIQYISGRRNYSSNEGSQAGARREKYRPNVLDESNCMEDRMEALMHKIKNEVDNDAVKKIANKVNRPADDPFYSEMAELFRKKNFIDWIRDFQKEMNKGL